MLTDFTIKNFRGIKELTLPSLKRVNLFVGKNGVGKTSVLEALYIHANNALSGVLVDVLTKREEDVLEPQIQFLLDKLGHTANQATTTPTFLTNGQEHALRTKTHHDHVEVRYETPAGHYVGTVPFLANLKVGDLGYLPKPLQALLLGPAGLDQRVIALLWESIELTPGEEHVMDVIRRIVPSIASVRMRANKDRVGAIAKLAGETGPVPLKRFGDGATRAFSLAVAIVSVQNGILLVDEIENGLHYSVLADVWKQLQQLSKEFNVQVFATTHSRDAVYALAEAAEGTDDAVVIRLERHGDQLTARTIEQGTLAGVVEQEVEIR